MDMVLAVVTRMASNSFQLKGWEVLLVSGLFGLSAAGSRRGFALIAYLPTIAFWLLDAYYLRQERLFRKLFDHVRQLDDDKVDYSMNTAPFAGAVAPTWRVAISISLVWFYGPLLITVGIVSALADR